MKRIVLYIISSIVCSLASCGDNALPTFDEPAQSTISVAHLKSLCKSSSTTIKDDVSVVAYVVANDLYGEYNKAIVVGDDSGCIEVLVNHVPTATHFPVSAQVKIHCTGLALGTNGGKIILGAQPTAEYRVDYITPSLVAQHFHIDRSCAFEILPQKVAIADLSTRHIGNYVALNNITFGDDAGLAWCDIDPETNKYVTTMRTLHDKEGHKLQVRTLAECSYRHEKIPLGVGTVWGIVEYFNDTYSLRIVNHNIAF